jgi:hypothetical protein
MPESLLCTLTNNLADNAQELESKTNLIKQVSSEWTSLQLLAMASEDYMQCCITVFIHDLLHLMNIQRIGGYCNTSSQCTADDLKTLQHPNYV